MLDESAFDVLKRCYTTSILRKKELKEKLMMLVPDDLFSRYLNELKGDLDVTFDKEKLTFKGIKIKQSCVKIPMIVYAE
jgi:hypothetical protein